MRNQPTYNFFKNTRYAINGLKDIINSEKSFQIELAITIILVPILIFIDLIFFYKLLMFSSLMFILIAETINSAIERVVDLITLEHNKMAGRAKDIGSTIVFLSIANCVLIWILCLSTLFKF